MFKFIDVVAAANLASLQFNAVYEFVNDTRYTEFIKTCNEWRADKINFKVSPVIFAAGELSST